MTNDQQQAPTATVTTPTDREIHIERVFDAPRGRVFAVFTDPQLIPEWWGPRDTTTTVDRMDVKRGGDWRFVIRHSDGRENAFRGTYREVIPPERIVKTFEWEGMPGHVGVETATFEDLGDRTKVTETSLFHTTEERDGVLASGMERGRTRCTPDSTRCSRGSPLADGRSPAVTHGLETPPIAPAVPGSRSAERLPAVHVTTALPPGASAPTNERLPHPEAHARLGREATAPAG